MKIQCTNCSLAVRQILGSHLKEPSNASCSPVYACQVSIQLADDAVALTGRRAPAPAGYGVARVPSCTGGCPAAGGCLPQVSRKIALNPARCKGPLGDAQVRRAASIMHREAATGPAGPPLRAAGCMRQFGPSPTHRTGRTDCTLPSSAGEWRNCG